MLAMSIHALHAQSRKQKGLLKLAQQEYNNLRFAYAIPAFKQYLLLKKNGTIIIDDVLHNGVKKCVQYIETNYKFYKKNQSPITVASFTKKNDDNREWNFHINF